jgi:hypothetical protein
MTNHLSPREFAQALESDGAGQHFTHLETCDACRRELADLRSLVSDLSVNKDVPEPSPLFWSHFSERVRVATQGERLTGGWHWLAGWRTLAMAAVTALIVVAVGLQSQRTRIVSHESPVTAAVPAADMTSVSADTVGGNQEAWDFMAVLASDVSSDDWHGVAAATPGAADTLAANLTPEQQRELARLLRAEIGGTE